jgi:NADH:ubiquinone oxidoreductase subunit 6 (subunit J)
MFSIQDLPTLIPSFVLIGLSIFLISNKNKVYAVIKTVKSFLF